MLSWELHATLVELHPVWSITPDQWALHPIRTGAMLTDRVHDPIGNKPQHGYMSGVPSPFNRPDTTLPQGYSSKHGRHPTTITLVPKWCYTT